MAYWRGMRIRGPYLSSMRDRMRTATSGNRGDEQAGYTQAARGIHLGNAIGLECDEDLSSN